MKVYALYGKSGTGKSTSALTYAYEENIPAIIDDGLLIFKGKKIAGTSAKFEKNYIKAVKRATFFDENHAAEVRKALQVLAIDKILLIGTSKNMVNLIAEKLELDSINYFVRIEEIRTSSEIKIALFSRRTQGNHIMPIPHVQVEESFLKKLIRQGAKIFSPKKELIGETTIIQPHFHRNTLHISEGVFEAIAKYAAVSIPEVLSCDKVNLDLKGLPSLSLDLTMKYLPERDLRTALKAVQQKVNEDFMNFFELELLNVNLHITKIIKDESS
ncbi:MAG TPA: hypothetical protein VFT51_09115 [Bacillales bacterium]|nr:hypothetical protein [Bacillales bacterium]